MLKLKFKLQLSQVSVYKQNSSIFMFQYRFFYITGRTFGNRQLTIKTMYLQLIIIILIFTISYNY